MATILGGIAPFGFPVARKILCSEESSVNYKAIPPRQKRVKKIKMRTRMSIPILLVVAFQLVTFLAVLVFGGEFRYIREYAYGTLLEKTENRSIYIQNELQAKQTFVQEYAEDINAIVEDILTERGQTIADLQADAELAPLILESSTPRLRNLIQRTFVNDAYLILETGDLFSQSEQSESKAALYLRAMDSNAVSGYDSLLMEIGFSSIAKAYGITRHSSWAETFTPNPSAAKNFDFYYTTLKMAQQNSGSVLAALGYWSDFSNPFSSMTPSLKYTLPLISADGTVYGLLGIGLLESTVLASIPSFDFLNETACYVLAHSASSNGAFDIVCYSGSSYDTLLGRSTSLRVLDQSDEGIYNLEAISDYELVGGVEIIPLYRSSSPYASEQWALIYVADRTSILRPLLMLRQMLALSAVLSIAVAAAVAVLSCSGIIRPISEASALMKTKRKYNEIIRFRPSNIHEIDEMTDAITQLQINVQNFSSQVSKMITLADVGLGTFMYDGTDDSVFVGQSLIKTLGLNLPQNQDIVMDRPAFLASIDNPKIRNLITDGLSPTRNGVPTDYSEVYKIDREDGAVNWLRVGYIYAPGTTIGIVQDVTETVLEKERIEYERDYDSLTGLLNRHAYYRRIQDLFADKDKLGITAFVMSDLDHLKYVNDTYGHDFGDDYIRTAASVLRKFQNYGGIVSRISGDEFNVCLPGFSSKDEVREIIAQVRSELLGSSCLLADGTHFRLRASMGVSWYPDDADAYEPLMKYADFAMYTIKHSTRGGIAEFNSESYAANSVLLTGVAEMNRIIEERSVRYAFQSIVSAKTGEVYGYEALMRVQSEIFRSPLELLRTAKTSAKLSEIELLTWSKALEDFKALVDSAKVDPKTHVFINAIANSYVAPEDEAALRDAYADFLPQIVLELLEGETTTQENIAHKLQSIKEMGAQLALDDFGTGYNSEYALLSLNPDIIKLDHSIINGCDKDESQRMLINNLVKLARSKGILVLAEGVETQEEMETVIACGVDFLQGYYLAYPVFDPQPLSPQIVASIREMAAAAERAQKSAPSAPAHEIRSNATRSPL